MKTKTLAIRMELDGELHKGIVEKRKHLRLSTHVHGEIFYGAEAVEVEVRDLSKSGARLKPSTRLESLPQVGETIDLSLFWPIPAETRSLHVEAMVVRAGVDDIAVEFSHVSNGNGLH